MTTDQFIITITEDMDGHRLDKALAALADGVSRARIQALLAGGHVVRAGKQVSDASAKVKAGETYTVTVPPLEEAVPQAENIALDVIYEDADLLVINKPPGLVVHPGAGNASGTLVNALLAHCGDSLSGIGGVKRPGIVHRLDKDTSGLLLVAKNDMAHNALSRQLSTRELTRVYAAYCWGVPSPREGVIETQIGRSPNNRQKMAVVPQGGKDAVTHYALEKNFAMFASKVSCRLKTGRTHQIRVHMTHIRHPLIGDPVYRPASVNKQLAALKGTVGDEVVESIRNFPRQALHAAEIAFVHPRSGKIMRFSAPLPRDLEILEATLGSAGLASMTAKA